MIPILLKPNLVALKNRCFLTTSLKQRGSRDMVVALMSGFIMFFVYDSAFSLLVSLNSHGAVHFHPTLLLGFFFAAMLCMLLFSFALASLGVLFLGKDLDFLLATPIRPFAFFSGKTIQIISSSFWTMLMFGVPLLAAFGRFYDMHWAFYLYSLLLILFFFFIPAGLSEIAVISASRLIPIRHSRLVLLLAAATLLIIIYATINFFTGPAAETTNLDDFIRIISLLSAPHQRWLPSYWLAVCLGSVLSPTGLPHWPYLVLLLSSAIFISALAYMMIRHLYLSAYSYSQQSRQFLTLQSRRSQRRLERLTFFMNGSTRAILGKELKLFARDFGQALQLLLLIGICFIYLYNFQFLREHQDVTEVVMVWWRGLLVLANMCMGSFVITAVCSRFVYPAVSLEGHAYWLLASAPLDFKTFLRAKFRIWLLPVTLIAVVIFVSGAMAIDAPVQILAVTAALSCITAYGLTGLGVGLGALFVDFQWENPAQLSASLGSLLYMLSSIALTGANLLAATLLILACILEDFRSSVPIWICYSLGLSAFIFVLWLNHTVASWAMRNGEQALLRLQKQ